MRSLTKTLIGVALLALALTPAPGTQAGPNNTALTAFSSGGPQALHLYTAVGVIKNNNIETVFICTNLGPGSAHIGVEVFDKTGSPGNSIATGKKPSKHGIVAFAWKDEEGTPHLYLSSDRKTHALWNIASEAGLTVGVVNWWNTYPPERVRGVIVSDHSLALEIERDRKSGV